MSKLVFPNGKVVHVEFDETAHSYVVAHEFPDGTLTGWRPTHGITAPLEVVPKPFLTPWGAKEGVLATLNWGYENASFFLEDGVHNFFDDLKAYEDKERTPDNKPVMSYYKFAKLYPWYSKLKSAYKEKSKEGKELGSWIHSAIELYYKSGRKQKPVITEFVSGMWDSFIEFDNFFKPVPDADGLEFIVYSLLYGYSGQGDFRGTISGKHCIGDWKSTNRSDFNADGISVEYFFQLGGLANAEYERTGYWVDDVFIANFDKKGNEPRVVFASEFGMAPQDCAKAFLSCFNTYHTIKEWDYKYGKK